MKPKTEEFLNLLLWTADHFLRPTFRNWTDSYECWAYRNGLLRQTAVLERQHLLERDRSAPDDRVYRLTWQGRLHVLGGREPEAQWGREWDGHWRLVLFDIPTTQNSHREHIRRFLRGLGFGYLQKSVWITPNSLEDVRQLLDGGQINVHSLVLLKARACGGESDAQIVTGAWDFEKINERYTKHLESLSQRPTGISSGEAAGEALLRWGILERAAWLEAVTNDPLLPERLLPSGYLGKEAWKRRVATFREAGRQLCALRA